MRWSLWEPVHQIVYLGSKPLPAMIKKVNDFLKLEHTDIWFSVPDSDDIAKSASSELVEDKVKEGTIEEMWPHSVNFSDAY